jgi:site-specific recombinase XerD
MTKILHLTLSAIFHAHVRQLATVLRPGTVILYKTFVNKFLSYLETAHPGVRTLSQLRRDPHMLGWLRSLHEQQPPLANNTKVLGIITLRRILNDLAASHSRMKENLLVRSDIPRVDKYIPKPFSPEDDLKLREHFLKTDDLVTNTLLLLRAVGMRIGEFLDLETDSLRQVSDNQWAIKAPLGKLHTERWIPVDEEVCRVFNRILSLRSLIIRDHPNVNSTKLILQQNGLPMTRGVIRRRLKTLVRQAGCSTRTYPHRFRHTYATEMLRAGASLPVVMKLLGHKNIDMTLRYTEVNNMDLQREYHQARSKMSLPTIPKISRPRNSLGIPTLLQALAEAHRLMEMFRRQTCAEETKCKLARLINRIEKILAEISNFG